ncbi:DUF885 family protein [Metamycoplasma salivarium]|uniref:DUF885 family protein n=1 Tax=Metamycoplasma salivarium TaxID=2124 RepID=UPI001F26F939|nr:DUF885 family protein [Metamycoplasma salivarium]GIZ06184.1 hypothetical protein MSATCC23557_1560 [Metamycoplasma salivarium]
MLKRNKILLSAAGIFATLMPLAAISARCGRLTESEKQAQNVVALKDKFNKEFKEKFPIPFPDAKENEEIIKFIQSYIDEINKIDTTNLDNDVVAWINGLKYNWEVQQGNYKNGLRYLFSSFDAGPSDTYVANAFEENILLDNEEAKDKAETDVKKEIAKRWYDVAKEAVGKNLVPSKLFIKNNVISFLSNLYAKKLEEFLNSSKTEITVKELIGFNSTKDEKDYTLQDYVDRFYDYYVSEYYKASTFGKGQDLAELKLYKTKQSMIDEKENILEFKATDGTYKQVYGLGLTDKDLSQDKAGIGYIPGKAGGLTGKDIYKQILKMCTTSEYTDQQVYDKGVTSTKSAATNMETIANAIADLIKGKDEDWTTTIKYDEDGLGSANVADKTLNIRKDKKINLPDFYKWLNSEDFFFGREDSSYYSADYKKQLEQDPVLAKGRKFLTDLGYDHLKSSTKQYGSITEQQFYYGALEAFKGYEQFKKTTMDYGRSFFGNKVPDYDIQTYEYAKRSIVGVGAEDPENKRFSFNCDPYYSLPKWSVTSFANHESIMGHHNQFMYADNFLAKVGGVNLGPRTFNYTSYIEGWALFMEWFGIEAGYYGTPDYTSDDYYAMPKDFSFAKGITSFATADNVSKPEVIEQIKNLHGGVYWNKVAEVNKYIGKDEDHAKAAIKLANMLQYIGALNEAQLRNMRLAVDTAYHGGTVAGNSDLPAGASIKQARDYMTKNSALGIGDITSESKRYFNLAGQATSYNSGKEVFMDLYKKIHNKLGLTREQFINQVTPEFKEHGQIKKFFDLILRNSALPMGAIEEIMKRVYGI